MKFSFNIQNFAPFDDVHHMVELAKEAEAAGWDGFFLWDHIHWDGPPMLDPWVTLAAIAMATERIRIGALVTPLARRRPWKLARETVTLDHLSRGRLIVGAGLGFPVDVEFARLGEETDDRLRAGKLDEGLDVLTGLWSGQPFSYQGEHYQLDNVTFLPKPVQERIPVWVAGMWPAKRPFRRAARYDGVVPLKVQPSGEPALVTPEDLATIVDYVREHRDSTNPPGGAPFDVALGVYLPPDRAQARDIIDAYAAAGATWLIDSPPNPDAVSERIRAGLPGAK